MVSPVRQVQTVLLIFGVLQVYVTDGGALIKRTPRFADEAMGPSSRCWGHALVVHLGWLNGRHETVFMPGLYRLGISTLLSPRGLQPSGGLRQVPEPVGTLR